MSSRLALSTDQISGQPRLGGEWNHGKQMAGEDIIEKELVEVPTPARIKTWQV